MKKIFLFILCLLIIPVNVFASTNILERTPENGYNVKKEIDLTYGDRLYDVMKTPSVNADEKIYDFADLFNEKEEDDLLSIISEFIVYYNMDFAVVTIDENPYNTEVGYTSNPDYYSMYFADNFYDYNSFGKGSDNSGLLFLIDMSNRFIWISSTGSARYYFNESNVWTLLDYSVSNFTGGNYYEGLKDTIYIMSEEFDKSLEDYQGIRYISSKDVKRLQSIGLVSAIISIITAVIFFSVNMSKCKTAKVSKDAHSYTNVNHVNVVNDILVHRSHTSHIISSGSGSGGGGGHVGGSGISHSGGGHHF